MECYLKQRVDSCALNEIYIYNEVDLKKEIEYIDTHTDIHMNGDDESLKAEYMNRVISIRM